ncbi:MAG: carbohydrate-binding family 9-like protein [Gemmatimonadetes bacterium]|nr:carbohydrate-binding family 9-like protein [Gemmatimonadota bacterium]MBT4612133.1 carbohydrate-binding family 9-like protein [Gemmatimonadota bacterium]MBT5142676.1 carbohydrate-binding family 9-like protein [Gemmatimonadota bacterium]MBT5587652.1 carbohydrate-binding family 9-like protein [Gemmatimonadota bacterium]MBT5960574.1 carbohydrate-binding family 9-like protein [Gemmatimonadota bacterium]
MNEIATIAPHTIYPVSRTDKAPIIRGRLDEPMWNQAARTTRFVSASTGGVAFFDTQAAICWDDEALYVAGWLEEVDVWTTTKERRGLVWEENTFEIFIASDGALYQLSINPAGDVQQLLFIWKDAYTAGGRYDVADLNLAERRPAVVGGDAGPHHRRGQRWLFDEWAMQGLTCASRVSGDLNERHNLDAGWTVEISMPWSGLAHLLDGPSPVAGDRLRIALARNQVIDQMQQQFTTCWSWHTAGDAGLYAPEGYPVVELRS